MNKTEQSHHEEAAKLLEQAIEANPWISEPHVLLSQIYNQQGKWELAEKHALEALKILGNWGTVVDKR